MDSEQREHRRLHGMETVYCLDGAHLALTFSRQRRRLDARTETS